MYHRLVQRATYVGVQIRKGTKKGEMSMRARAKEFRRRRKEKKDVLIAVVLVCTGCGADAARRGPLQQDAAERHDAVQYAYPTGHLVIELVCLVLPRGRRAPHAPMI